MVGILYLVNFLHFWQNFRIALQQNLLKKLVPRIFSFVAAVNGVSIRSRFRLGGLRCVLIQARVIRVTKL